MNIHLVEGLCEGIEGMRLRLPENSAGTLVFSQTVRTEVAMDV